MKAALTEKAGGAIIKVGTLPFSHVLADGGTALLTEPGQEVPAHATNYRVLEYVEVNFDRPGTYYTQGEDVESRQGNVITITRQWTAWTQQEIAAYEVGRLDAIAERLNDVDNGERAIVLLMMDELNLHSTRLAAILQASADASNLATFKTAMAAIQPIQQRTPAQIKTAYRSKLGVMT